MDALFFCSCTDPASFRSSCRYASVLRLPPSSSGSILRFYSGPERFPSAEAGLRWTPLFARMPEGKVCSRSPASFPSGSGEPKQSRSFESSLPSLVVCTLSLYACFFLLPALVISLPHLLPEGARRHLASLFHCDIPFSNCQNRTPPSVPKVPVAPPSFIFYEAVILTGVPIFARPINPLLFSGIEFVSLLALFFWFRSASFFFVRYPPPCKLDILIWPPCFLDSLPVYQTFLLSTCIVTATNNLNPSYTTL